MSELGDVLELMHTAHRRFHSVRIETRECRHRERSQRAFERYAAENADRVGTGYVALGSDRGEDEAPEASEARARLWLVKPYRRRVERRGRDGRTRYESVSVHDGPRWWSYHAYGDTAEVVSNEEDESIGHGGQTELDYLLDPARLLPSLDLEPAGRTTRAGRDALAVRATPRRDGDFFGPGLPAGGDEHELAVDAERGVLLRAVSRLDGEEFWRVDVDEIAFDVEFLPETFRFEVPPGVRVRRPGGPRLEELSLDAAVRRAPFTLWKVPHLAPGWTVRVLLVDDDDSAEPVVNLQYHRNDAAEQFSIVHRPAGTRARWTGYGKIREVERDAVGITIIEPEVRGGPTIVQLDRGATALELHSQNLDAERLLELATSLVPASLDV